ncbi:MAG TPA: response regulator [Planctomycetota bacterium]|nr:response regulator [Planctomycetota bacterium]
MNADDDRDLGRLEFPGSGPRMGPPDVPEVRSEGVMGTIYLVGCSSEELLALFDLLSGAGLGVRAFSHPFEALESVARSHPGIVIADVHLPDMDGLELLGRVKDVSPKTRVILTTSDPDWPAYPDVLERGAETLIHKPIPPSVLLKLVGATLRTAG